MKLTKLERGEFTPTGDLRLTFQRPGGLSLTVDIPQAVAGQLLTGLLQSRTPEVGQPYQRPPLIAESLRLHKPSGPAGEYLVAEFYLTPKAAVLIALSPALAGELKRLLNEDPATWRDTKVQ